jgi:hypothetical protein
VDIVVIESLISTSLMRDDCFRKPPLGRCYKTGDSEDPASASKPIGLTFTVFNFASKEFSTFSLAVTSCVIAFPLLLEFIGDIIGASSLGLPIPAPLPVLDEECVITIPFKLWRIEALPLSDFCLANNIYAWGTPKDSTRVYLSLLSIPGWSCIELSKYCY